MIVLQSRDRREVGPPAWARHLTGHAAVDVLLNTCPDEIGELVVTSVTFEPGARTHWHSHAAGQLLVVVAGEGWVGTRATGRRIVSLGDVIWTPPGEEHWHGATDASSLTHIAMTLGETQWSHEPVVLS